MATDKIPVKETITKTSKCPSKHARAYRTSFGGKYCPDCGHNVEVKNAV